MTKSAAGGEKPEIRPEIIIAMRGRAASLVGPGDAKDVVQEALLRICRSPDTFMRILTGPDPKAAVMAYMLKVTRNVALRLLKKAGRARPEGKDITHQVVEGCISAVDVSGLWARAETKALVGRSLASLPPRDREVVRLFYFEGASLRDIPDLLGSASAGEPALRTANEVAVHLGRRIRPTLAMAVRAEACLPLIARAVIRLHHFEGRSSVEIRRALHLPARNTLVSQLYDPKTAVGATVRFLVLLRPLDRAVFRRFFFDAWPVERIAASLVPSSKAQSMSFPSVARRLRHVLARFVAAIEPLSS